ncbi:MAG TPA: glycoside hydrolase family 3 protein, partial [Ignavibacteriales bacterium]|nr:glycoside hydrolase family 3 protein [Ignavibacteriales bacterium]
MKKLAVFLSLFIIIVTAQAANSMDNNKGKSTPEIEKKIDALLTQLTLEEKLELIGGTGFASKPIERLGIPAINMTDGPVGVRWNDNTAFPVSAAMAATWNTELVNKIGIALGEETKAQGRNMLLGPCVNIVRVPMAGRNFETFGEDPYLTSRLAVAYINGLQSENVMASVKHFAVNNQEDGRMFINTKVDERTLNEIYFPAFKAAVQEAGVWTVMSAYNKINGPYCSESDYLLNKTLKQDWGFEGFVVSDWGAVHSVEGTANYGADIEMPTGEFMNPKNLTELVKSGKVKESTIDDKVRRLLRTMFLSGMMDGKVDKGATDTKEHRALALEAARESIVLLKNESGILPLDENKINSIAVIGPNAAVARTGGGGSSMVSPVYSVSPLEGLKNLLGNKIKLNYAQGASVKGDIKSIDPSNLKTEFSGKTESGL